jgi:hypothetical protein
MASDVRTSCLAKPASIASTSPRPSAWKGGGTPGSLAATSSAPGSTTTFQGSPAESTFSIPSKWTRLPSNRRKQACC